MEKKELKEYCIELLLQGKTVTEIANLTGWSRKYITNLLKNDERYLQTKNNKKIKVYKRKSSNHMIIYIPTTFIENLGISKDRNKLEYVNVSFDKKNNMIMIKKA